MERGDEGGEGGWTALWTWGGVERGGEGGGVEGQCCGHGEGARGVTKEVRVDKGKGEVEGGWTALWTWGGVERGGEGGEGGWTVLWTR